MLEKTIEKKVSDHAKKMGFLTHKLTSMYNRGFPDRLFVYKGYIFFIEFKRKGKKPTPNQLRIHDILNLHQVDVFVIDNVIDGLSLINKIKLNR